MSKFIIGEKESKNIQLLRALGIIAVVGIHTCGGGTRGVVIRPFINYAVSIFIFLSGFLTTDDLGGKTYFEFVKKRLLRIVPPYVLWSVFFTLINGTYREFIPYVLTGRCEGIYYFVFVYVQLVVITPLALNLLKSKWSWIGWLITPISIVVFYYIIGNNQELSFPFSGELCIFWFTYYYLGLFIRNTPGKKKAINIKRLIVLYIASLALQFGEGVIWNSVGNETLAITQLRISSFLSCMVFSVIGYHINLHAGAAPAQIGMKTGAA